MASLRSTRLRRLLLLVLPIVVAAVVVACAADDRQASDLGADDGDEAAPTAGATSSTTTPATETTAAPTSTTEATTTTAEPYTPVFYDGDFSATVAPILAEKCASCHAPGGPGTAHWELGTVADVAENRQALLEVVESGYMPPWPAGGASPAFHDDRSLRADQLQAIIDWAADGGPVDAEPTATIEPAVALVGLADPDLVVTPVEPYTGSVATTDDYRCQVYDPQLPDGGWITSYQFIPDRTEVVHHAIGYMVEADRRDEAAERDGEDGKPGWSCYGSSGLGDDQLFLGWAPGQDPSEFPDGTGLWIEPGGFIVLQIHYHYETSAPADRSALALVVEPASTDLDEVEVSSLVAPAEIPCRDGEEGSLCDRATAIQAARQKYGSEGVLADAILRICRAEVADFAAMTDGVASSSCDIPAGFVGADGEVISILGHQHEIGSWFRMTVNPDQPDEKVLLDIPDWDFDWQYNYAPVERIVIEPDDVIRIECGWDRARRDPQLEPAYVLWADGTDDEMCFATITTRPVP